MTTQSKASVVISDCRDVLMTFSERASLAIFPLIGEILKMIEGHNAYDKNKKYIYSEVNNIIHIKFNQIVFEDLLWGIRGAAEIILEKNKKRNILFDTDWCLITSYAINRSIEIINPNAFILDVNSNLLNKQYREDPTLIAESLLAATRHNFVKTYHLFENGRDPLSVAKEVLDSVTYEDGSPIQDLNYSIYGSQILLFIEGNRNKLIGYVNCNYSVDYPVVLLLIKGFVKNDKEKNSNDDTFIEKVRDFLGVKFGFHSDDALLGLFNFAKENPYKKCHISMPNIPTLFFSYEEDRKVLHLSFTNDAPSSGIELPF